MQNIGPNNPETPDSRRPQPSRYQVAIVGAGPAGSALALVLAGAGLSVLILEQSAFGVARVGELLSPDAVHILCQMAPSLGKRLLGLALSVVSAWSGDELVKDGDGSEMPWRAVDRRELDRSLAEEATNQGARLITSARLTHSEFVDGRWKLQIEHDGEREQLESDYLVDATGRASLVSRQLGAIRLRQSGQVAVGGFLSIPEKQDIPHEMLLETTNDGWWYSAPLSEHDAVAVFITDDDLDKGQPEEAWQRAFEASRHTKDRYSRCLLKERPRRVAANSSMLLPSFGEGWMAIGDAAACFDPLSIHGLGRALLQGAKVGEFLAESFANGDPPNPMKLAEDNGEEFLKETLTLSVNYRRVKQWPESIFWRRRDQGYPSTEVGRQMRRPKQSLTKLIFTSQKFQCDQCGRCQRVAWPELRQTSADTPLEPFDFPALTDQKRDFCRRDTGDDPRTCGQFPFVLRETPQGVVVGVSPLCRSVQSGQGQPLHHYSDWVQTLLEDKPPPVLPRKVAVSWGRGIDWEQYLQLESGLLANGQLAQALRQLRWELSLWACDPSRKELETDVPEETPDSFLGWLENLLVGSLLCCLEHDPGTNSSDLFRYLVEDRPVSFPRFGWEGRFSELPQAKQLQDVDWMRAEIAVYQRHLLERKFLVIRAPLLHNLCLLSVMPNFLLTYSLLFSMHRGADRIEQEDYFRALELAETEIVTYGRLDQLSHTIVGFHLDRALEARKATSAR